MLQWCVALKGGRGVNNDSSKNNDFVNTGCMIFAFKLVANLLVRKINAVVSITDGIHFGFWFNHSWSSLRKKVMESIK